MFDLIDKFLNKITMYRLVLYVLCGFAAAALVCSAFGLLSFTPLALIFSTLLLLVAAWIANFVFAKVFHVPANVESVYITALILALIITPVLPTNGAGVGFLVAAAVIAMASKYILAIRRKHVFNPAALAVFATGLLLGQYASWWVGGNLALLPFVFIGGFLITRKIQRSDLVLTFLVAAFATIVATSISGSGNPLEVMQKALLHTPVLFFAFIMITEPLTTPPTLPLRIAYAAAVGILFAPAVHFGGVYMTPELALLIGNVYSYILSPKIREVLALKERREVGTGIYDFVFAPQRALAFQPGQYLEWTLGHRPADSRGNRRYFTIASSPTEPELRLGVRFYDKASSFKRTMLAMAPGDTIVASQLAGDFVLPADPQRKLAFIAGGIGITPFRSMMKYLSDRGERRSIVLLYSNRTAADIAYREVFDEAERTIGAKTIYALTGGEAAAAPATATAENIRSGRIDAQFIAREIPDYAERTFYISGTLSLVEGIRKVLDELGVPRAHVVTDFFPGF